MLEPEDVEVAVFVDGERITPWQDYQPGVSNVIGLAPAAGRTVTELQLYVRFPNGDTMCAATVDTVLDASVVSVQFDRLTISAV